jgi:hypothetical protein
VSAILDQTIDVMRQSLALAKRNAYEAADEVDRLKAELATLRARRAGVEIGMIILSGKKRYRVMRISIYFLDDFQIYAALQMKSGAFSVHETRIRRAWKIDPDQTGAIVAPTGGNS